MKETYYFSHDYNARADENIKLLIRKWGMEGYGIFWALVEDLYNNSNELRLDIEGISYDLRMNESIIKSVIFDFDLFSINDGIFGSSSIERRMNERDEKSKKTSKSATLRWEKYRQNANASKTDANALDVKVNRNAIKDRKDIKESIESKEKDSNESLSTFELFLKEEKIFNFENLEFLNSAMWFESKAMQLSSETDILTGKAKEFLIDVRDRDMLEGKTLIDLRSHFVSWYKKKRDFERPANKPKYVTPEFSTL